MEIVAVDLIIVAIVAISGLISLVRGFVKEAMSLIIWIAAFVVSMTFSDRVAILLQNLIELASMRQLVAWGGLFCWHPVIGCDNKLYVCQDNRLYWIGWNR